MFMYESGLTFPQIIVMYALTSLGPLAISTLAHERLPPKIRDRLTDVRREAVESLSHQEPDE